ncbi:MAG: GNAT family protein [Ferruginibacter sp.]
MQYSQLSTSRLILKGIDPPFIKTLFSNKTKEEIMAFFGFGEQGYMHYKYMYEGGMETFRLSLFVFLLVDKQSNEPIGECGYHTLNRTHRRAEVFYNMTNEDYKQKGYMTEALEAVLEYGFTELGLHRVEALVAADNTASLKLLRRYGFSFEGTMREDYCVNGVNEDSDCYSLLKKEWEGRKV